MLWFVYEFFSLIKLSILKYAFLHVIFCMTYKNAYLRIDNLFINSLYRDIIYKLMAFQDVYINLFLCIFQK